MLAASVVAGEQDRVLELGAGVGVASLALSWRTKANVTGLELQPEYAQLAQKNATENGIEFIVVPGDLRNMPDVLKQQSFDQVIANPPYYLGGTNSDNVGRDSSLRDGADLSAWVDAAIKRLKPKGYMTFIQRADRLQDLIKGCDSRVGDLRILPVSARVGRDAELVILRARKGAKGPLKLLAPIVLHAGDTHVEGGKKYAVDIEAVLRNGEPLKVSWV